jgi:hypothetical protein
MIDNLIIEFRTFPAKLFFGGFDYIVGKKGIGKDFG